MKPPFPVVLYGFGLLLAFGAGWLLKPEPFPPSAPPIKSGSSDRKSSPLPVKANPPLRTTAENWLAGAMADLEEIASSASPGQTNPALLAKLDAILSFPGANVRQAHWQTLLTAMRAEDAAAVHELFRAKARDGRHFDREFETFCHRWGQLHGTAAAQTIVSTYAGTDNIVSHVLMGWGSRDAIAALAWADQQPGLAAEKATSAIVKGLGQKSAREAESLVLANWNSKPFVNIRREVAAMHVAEKGFSGTLPWFEQIAGSGSPDKFKVESLETLLKIANKGQDAGKAIQLARQYAGQPWLPMEAGNQIGFSYIGEDPMASLNALAQLPSKPAQEAAVRVFYNHMGQESTSQWLIANPARPH